MFLRQSTSQVVLFGPCLDKDDGVTEETGLTLAQADMRLSKDGGAFGQKSAAGNATHDSDGWYNTTLSTTDTATVGELRLNVHQPANMLPVWDRWWVIEEAIYDALYGASATGYLAPTTATRTLDVNAAGEAGLDLDNTSGTLAAAQFAADFLTNAKIADNAFNTEQFVADFLTSALIADGAFVAANFAASSLDGKGDWNTVTPDAAGTAPTFAEIWTTQLTESYNADGAAPTPAQALHLLIALLSEFSISDVTLTAKKLDGSTSAATFTLSDDTNPTSITRAS